MPPPLQPALVPALVLVLVPLRLPTRQRLPLPPRPPVVVAAAAAVAVGLPNHRPPLLRCRQLVVAPPGLHTMSPPPPPPAGALFAALCLLRRHKSLTLDGPRYDATCACVSCACACADVLRCHAWCWVLGVWLRSSVPAGTSTSAQSLPPTGVSTPATSGCRGRHLEPTGCRWCPSANGVAITWPPYHLKYQCALVSGAQG